jgi:hypothetical protein
VPYLDDPELAEAAKLAVSAEPSADCVAPRHGTYSAHRRAGCSCPETVALVRLQRRRWEVGSRAKRAIRDEIARSSVRPEVLEAFLAGRRREVRYTHREADEAFRRAVEQHGEHADVLARVLDYSLGEAQRRLRRLRVRVPQMI